MVISLGKIDAKYFRYIIIYILIMISINIVSYFLKKGKAEPENILLILIISHGSLIFFIIFECWLRKTISKQIPSEDKSKGKSESKKTLKYIYNAAQKFNIKKFLILF